MADNTVPLADSAGNIQDIPQEQAQDMLSNGYTQPDADALQAHSDDQLNSSLKQQVEGGVEGAANTLSLGASTKLETMAGIPAADIQRRSHTAGHMLGQGLAIAALPEMGIAEGALGAVSSSAIQMALAQAGDEGSKMILDPNASVGNAIHNIGTAALLGGAFGVGGQLLKGAAKAAADTQFGKIAADFKSRASDLISNPEPAAKITEELQGADKYVQDAQLHGDGGLKDQVIAKLSPEVNFNKAVKQGGDILQSVQDSVEKAQSEPGIYQGARVSALSDYAARLKDSLEASQDSGSVFKAINDFKKGIGGLGNWSPLEGAVEKPSAQLLKDVYHQVQGGLEDTSTWGKLGKFQQATNEATSDLINAEKNLNKFKSVGADGSRVLDPAKIESYVNQTAKGSGAIKQDMVKSYVDAIGKYSDNIADIHNELGIESPIPAPSMQHLQSTLGTPTVGSKLADFVVKKGLNNVIGEGAGSAIGAGLGSMVGAPGMGALIGERAISPFINKILPALTQPLLKGAISGPGMAEAASLGASALKGQMILENASKAAIGGGRAAALKSLIPSKEETAKLQDQVTANQKDPNRMIASSSRVGDYMPDHAAMIGAKASMVTNYLAQAEPKPVQQNVFDRPIEPTDHQKMAYERTLQIAQKPVSLMYHIAQGSLIPSDVKDINAMHPDVHQAMTEQLTKHAIETMADGGVIPRTVQQAISLFAGQPLSASMTPQAIMAAQNVFTQQQASQQGQSAPGKAKKSDNGLNKLAEQATTPGQARQQARQSSG